MNRPVAISVWLQWVLTLLIAFVGPGRGIQASDVPAGPPSDQVTDHDRQFWAFQKNTTPAIPPVVAQSRVRSPVDAFILSQLEAKGLSLSPDADRRTLLRRVWLDLIGNLPSPESAAEFLANESPEAYEALVDRLLASPQFGERWGRHWLDVAGYVDTVGFDVDVDLIIASERKWLYRDYVIRAFNEDKPYDRFLLEQIAGDELVDWRNATMWTPEIRELLVATGYLRNAQDLTHEDVGNIPQNHFGTLHDTLEIVGTSLLGLTLNCARCHNHKFDSIPQEDYYRLMAVFTPAYNPNAWKIVFPYDKKIPDRSLPDAAQVDVEAIELHNGDIDRQLAKLSQKLNDLRRLYREKLIEQKLLAIPEPIRVDTKTAVALPADKRNEVQKYLAEKFASQLKVSDDEIARALEETDKATAAEIARQTASVSAKRRSYSRIQALYDVGPPPVTRRLVRGNFETPGEEVQPGFLRALCDDEASALMKPIDAPFADTSGRRLALARWLTARNSRAAGMTSRVAVNHVWQRLFQKGIVPTPENFGLGGASPTHPQLLEWLASQLVESGWRIKPMIRQIVCSSVYRQSSGARANGVDEVPVEAEQAAVDSDNRLLGRMRLKRLDSEAIRDCILAASGTMDTAMGGAPVMLEGKPDGMIVVNEKQLSTPTAKWRRSVYLLSRRAFQLSELAVFDQPVVSTSCPERARSAVPLQSLTMLNGAFLWEQADQFAARLREASSAAVDDCIVRAFERVLVRQPSADEIQQCSQFLDRQAGLYREKGLDASAAAHKALVHLCHTLLNTSEFLYTP